MLSVKGSPENEAEGDYLRLRIASAASITTNDKLTFSQLELWPAPITLLTVEFDLGPLVRLECDVLNLCVLYTVLDPNTCNDFIVRDFQWAFELVTNWAAKGRWFFTIRKAKLNRADCFIDATGDTHHYTLRQLKYFALRDLGEDIAFRITKLALIRVSAADVQFAELAINHLRRWLFDWSLHIGEPHVWNVLVEELHLWIRLLHPRCIFTFIFLNSLGYIIGFAYANFSFSDSYILVLFLALLSYDTTCEMSCFSPHSVYHFLLLLLFINSFRLLINELFSSIEVVYEQLEKLLVRSLSLLKVITKFSYKQVLFFLFLFKFFDFEGEVSNDFVRCCE